MQVQATLKKVGSKVIKKTGTRGASYVIPGTKARIQVSGHAFAGEPPASLTIDAEGLREPSAREQAAANRAAPASLEARIEKTRKKLERLEKQAQSLPSSAGEVAPFGDQPNA